MSKLDYDFFGDDLGTIQYNFKNSKLVDAVNHVIGNADPYKIVSISIKKKYWLFGRKTTTIVCENPNKIRALKGGQHYSGSLANKDTIVDKETFERLVQWLSAEYPREDAIHDLEHADFLWEGTHVLRIKYANDKVDRLMVLSNRLIHLNRPPND